MSTARGKLLPFWRNIQNTTDRFPDVTDAEEQAIAERPLNMEELAKRVELARMNKVDCDAEAMKADSLLQRCIDEYEAEEARRGLKSRK